MLDKGLDMMNYPWGYPKISKHHDVSIHTQKLYQKLSKILIQDLSNNIQDLSDNVDKSRIGWVSLDVSGLVWTILGANFYMIYILAIHEHSAQL